MCGLTGFWSFKKPQNHAKETLTKMTQAIAHRGPDSNGIWFNSEQGLGLGHQRLSIVDLSANGHQPMFSSSGQSTIVYNGEIYNAKAIRQKLLKEYSLTFKGDSDTEVILEACEAWGVEATLKQLNGMFAFAYWSKSQKTLTLARDRVGIKPLYWGVVHGVLLFGSQQKSTLSSSMDQ